MEDTEDSGSTGEVLEKELDLDEILRLETGLKAPRWRERAEAARSAASTLVKDGCLRQFSSEEDLRVGASQVPEVYNKLLRLLLHGLALKDSNWQVRVEAVESASTILAAAKAILPVDTFAEFVWIVLAASLDGQSEVQETASNCIFQRLLVPSSSESHVLVLRLCDHFVEAAIGADSSLLRSSKLATKLQVTGLDYLPNGETLLAAMTAAICLQLMPLPPVSDAEKRQKSLVPDRTALLLVVVAAALEDAIKRQSRVMAGGFSRLLRCLGKPFYRQPLLAMFNVKSPVYFAGPDLARAYQNAGIISEDTADVVKNITTVTIFEGLSLAFGASHDNESWADVIISKNRSASELSSQTVDLCEGEIIALERIVKMLRVPDDLIKTRNGEDMDSKAFHFAASAMPLLRISVSIIEDRKCAPQEKLLPDKLVEDLLLCCAAFAGGDMEYGGTATWTSKELRELSITLLTSLSNVDHPVGVTPASNGGEQENSLDKNRTRLILGHISSLLPRLKQIIQDSSGSPGNDEILLKLSPEGSLGASIVAAHQMQLILSQLDHKSLGPRSQLVMPCVLTALDHFSPEVKRQAMRSCIHLALNMNPTELQWYRDVTLDAVARNLVGCEDLWPVAVKMAVTVVTRIEERNPRGQWSGRIFAEMLDELARHRDDQGRRTVWLQEISPHMEALGLVLVAHFNRLLPLLLYWLHAPDDLTCILTLKRLQTVITNTWPRIPVHVKRIWKELKDTFEEALNRKASSEIQAAVVEVCRLLYSCAGPTLKAVVQQDENGTSEELVSVVTTMMKEAVV